MLGDISSGGEVVEGRGNESIDDATRCTVGVWIECVYVVAKRARRHGRHAAELSATEDADRGAGRDRCSRQVVLSRPARSVLPNTSAVPWARHSRRRSRSSGRVAETIEAARRAAMAAPGSPIANAPTGTAFGICTVESSVFETFSNV